jgi:hypothetical protein
MQIGGGVRGTRRPHPVHLLNTDTRRSYCQYENNADPQGKPSKFDKLPETQFGYPVQVCKSCTSLSESQKNRGEKR